MATTWRVAVGTDETTAVLEGADHSFHVVKSSGRTDADVLDEIGSATRAWVARCKLPTPIRGIPYPCDDHA